MALFSSSAEVSLEKVLNVPDSDFDIQNVSEIYETDRCVEWILQNKFEKVCLQFPDHMLPAASKVAIILQKSLGQTVYILGDTAYESCCLDYVAAKHIEADAIIHFGPTCFSLPTNQVPALFIYEKLQFDLNRFSEELKMIEHENLIVVLDTCYLHLKDALQNLIPNLKIIGCADSAYKNITSTETVVFICDNTRKCINFSFICKYANLYVFSDNKLNNFNVDGKILKRRNFLSEKIKDASTVGILIGTLAVRNYLSVIERLKKILKAHSKKYYMISVGKPNVAKLANFPEMDLYVLIACSMNEIFDSRDFYKPIVTVYDVEFSLNNATDSNFSYEIDICGDRPVMEPSLNECDVSLISGKVRGADATLARGDGDTQLQNRTNGALVASGGGAQFLLERSWQGLEQKLGQTEVKLAEEGRRGLAQGYSNEQL